MAGEKDILKALLSRARAPLGPGVVGPGDDGAVLPASLLAGDSLVLTCDALEEGVHFRRGWLSFEDLAHKLLAVNLSDAAAMGAEPVGLLVAAAWSVRDGDGAARRFSHALEEACAAARCPLLGGDTDVRDAPLRLEATMIARSASPLLRSGGRAGDVLFVSGPLGGAALAVRAWERGAPLDAGNAAQADALRCFRRPRPRLDVSRHVASRSHAGIDLSDGLRSDASRLARASGLAARIETSAIPRHPALAVLDAADALGLLLDGGEDYELLLAGDALLGQEPGLTPVGMLVTGEPGDVSFA